MARIEETPKSNVEVVPALREHEPVLANLLELYSHDFSELFDLELDESGRFGYPRLSLYWTEPRRHHPFLVRVNRRLAGFVFIQKGSQITGDVDVLDVAEFFIARGYRKLGVGTRAAHIVWRLFPGRWEVRVMEQNHVAGRFWERAVTEFVGAAASARSVESAGRRWRLFTFQS